MQGWREVVSVFTYHLTQKQFGTVFYISLILLERLIIKCDE